MKPHAPGLCDVIPYTPIPADRMRQIESSLTAASGLVAFHAEACGYRSKLDFFADFMSHYRVGREVSLSNHVIPAAQSSIMMKAKDLESELLAGFSRMIQKAVNLCSRAYGRDQSELQADAYESFFRAVINYSGGASFSTYLWHSLTRNLSRACLDRGELKVPRDVRKIAMRVVEAMTTKKATFDEAVDSMGITEECRKKVVAAMSKVSSATELDIRQSDMVSCQDAESLDWVMKAVERADLGFLERAVLKGFLEAPSGVMGLTEGCRDMINPDTGRPYSRYALSAAWKRARHKIARAIEEAA